MLLAVFFTYIFLQILLGSWLASRMKSESDYFLAGRSLGPVLASFSIFATWFGAETIVGSTARSFHFGFAGGRADPLGYTLCLLIFGYFLAQKFWELKIVTLGDLFRIKFGRVVEKISVPIMVLSSLLWAAAQIRAFGHILGGISELPLEQSILIASLLVTLYTMLGGLLADVITDLIQGVILILGLLILLVAMMYYTDFSFIDFIQKVPKDHFKFYLPLSEESILSQLDGWLVPILGSLVAQELVARSLASRNALVAKNSSYVASIIYLIVGSIPIAIGFMATQVKFTYDDPEKIVIILSKMFLPEGLYVFFLAALASAILSTIDSALLAFSGLISHNILYPTLRIKDEKKKVQTARFVVIFAGILAYYIAVTSESIYSLVETASSIGSAPLLVLCIVSFYSKKNYLTQTKPAILTLIVGVSSSLIGANTSIVEAPFLLSLILSIVTFFLSSLFLHVNENNMLTEEREETLSV